MKLSIVLATKNEETNIAHCLNSVKNIADEIIVVDEESTDNTRELAKSFRAKVYTTKHNPIFHITKQMAIDKASGEWVLQLDADEVVTKELALEIIEVINSNSQDLDKRTIADAGFSKFKNANLFVRHQKNLQKRDGQIGQLSGDVVAFFIPRKNMFLGKPLTYAGVYPDAVIRLLKKGKAYLPAKSVHEQMAIDGRVGWLENSLEHHDSPTLKRYLMRMNRYTDLNVEEFKSLNLPKNFIYLMLYTTYKPATYFLKLFIRHKGFKDGLRGFLWCLLSALHFPLAYYKYYTS